MSINRKKIIELMSKIKVIGNADGLIPAFGVYINQLPACFWNSFAEKLTCIVKPEIKEAAEYLLTYAANECGYHTGHGIINSEEWQAIVEPMIEKKPEDMLHGIFAVITAWGWAKAEIAELTPAERMVVRAYDYYESDIVRYGKSGKMSAYMITGISAAFMDLAYGKPYPDGLNTFRAKQIKGIEAGDDYAEFVVTKA